MSRSVLTLEKGVPCRVDICTNTQFSLRKAIVKLVRVVYVSTSNLSRQDESDELNALVAASFVRNRRYDITGTLICAGTHFAQLLEGKEADVTALMNNIRADQRHCHCRVITQESIQERSVERWLHHYSTQSTFVCDIVERSLRRDGSDASLAINPLIQLLTELAAVSS